MIEIDKNSKNLLLISYPSGGYGYYLARLINSFVTNVVKTNDLFLFDHLGTSHSLPLVAGSINFEKNYNLDMVDCMHQTDISQGKYIVIPYDSGISNDATHNIKKNFPNAKVVRLYYQDNTWPLVFQNLLTKTAGGTLANSVEFDHEKFQSSEDWARRENFSLLFETHQFRTMWKEEHHPQFLNIDIFELVTNPQSCLKSIASFINGTVTNLDLLNVRHQQFLSVNPNTTTHLEILQIINKLYQEQDLTHILQLYQQAALNFCIQLKFNFVVPPNTYANWFTNTKEIVTMLKDHGVYIDTN